MDWAVKGPTLDGISLLWFFLHAADLQKDNIKWSPVGGDHLVQPQAQSLAWPVWNSGDVSLGNVVDLVFFIFILCLNLYYSCLSLKITLPWETLSGDLPPDPLGIQALKLPHSDKVAVYGEM